MKKLTRCMKVRRINVKAYNKVTDEITDDTIMIPENEKTENYIPDDIVVLSIKEVHESTFKVNVPMDKFINFVVENGYYEVI